MSTPSAGRCRDPGRDGFGPPARGQGSQDDPLAGGQVGVVDVDGDRVSFLRTQTVLPGTMVSEAVGEGAYLLSYMVPLVM